FQENIADKGAQAEKEWEKLLEEYVNEFPELSEEFKLALAGELPKDWQENLPHYEENQEGPASRETSGEVLNAIAEVVPNFWGGSADLSGSNKTMINGVGDFAPDHYEG